MFLGPARRHFIGVTLWAISRQAPLRLADSVSLGACLQYVSFLEIVLKKISSTFLGNLLIYRHFLNYLF